MLEPIQLVATAEDRNGSKTIMKTIEMLLKQITTFVDGFLLRIPLKRTYFRRFVPPLLDELVYGILSNAKRLVANPYACKILIDIVNHKELARQRDWLADNVLS